jgi:hypothetical protein
MDESDLHYWQEVLEETREPDFRSDDMDIEDLALSLIEEVRDARAVANCWKMAFTGDLKAAAVLALTKRPSWECEGYKGK